MTMATLIRCDEPDVASIFNGPEAWKSVKCYSLAVYRDSDPPAQKRLCQLVTGHLRYRNLYKRL